MSKISDDLRKSAKSGSMSSLSRDNKIELDADGVVTYRTPSSLTHKLPDSFERIADELEAKTSSCGHQGYIVVSRDEVIQIADRIRKLAKREGD